MTETTTKVRTLLFPLSSTVRRLLTILEGVPKVAVTSMLNAIRDQTGDRKYSVTPAEEELVESTLGSEELQGVVTATLMLSSRRKALGHPGHEHWVRV